MKLTTALILITVSVSLLILIRTWLKKPAKKDPRATVQKRPVKKTAKLSRDERLLEKKYLEERS